MTMRAAEPGDLVQRLRYNATPELVMKAADHIEKLEDALERIVQWSDAYPLDVFPEPDWKRAAELLEAGGTTLDAISAHCMRHVVEGVGKIASAALNKDAQK